MTGRYSVEPATRSRQSMVPPPWGVGGIVDCSPGSDVLIQIWVPLRRGGVTPGMLVMGLRIETLRGGRPKGRAYLIRWVLLTVDGLLLGLVAMVSIVATRRRQRIGDLVARTLVVRTGTDGRRARVLPSGSVGEAAAEQDLSPGADDGVVDRRWH
ncbi:RDD family protein [Amycolatopsis sp. NPDC049252]|uniref:RDD family protein n=1 Tax=Amycolatopsis sp. NPDC049252 TaxID=3363933 RepID=UPI00371593C6